MNHRRYLAALVSGALQLWMWSPVSLRAQSGTTATVTTATYETREYRAENGRAIRITSLGNLVSLESPYGFDHINMGTYAREGYVVSYDDPGPAQTRVLYNVNDLYSKTLGGSRDLMPNSFTGPPTGTTFPINTPVTAIVVVDTEDNVIRLTHRFEWRAGLGRVTVTTTVTNRLTSPVLLRGFKRHADINVDGGGGYGNGGALGAPGLNDWAHTTDGILASVRCGGCPPTPPHPLTPETVSTHVVFMSGIPAPPFSILKSATDNSELFSAGPVLKTARLGARTNENNQVTLVWAGSALAPGAFRKFTTLYEVQ